MLVASGSLPNNYRRQPCGSVRAALPGVGGSGGSHDRIAARRSSVIKPCALRPGDNAATAQAISKLLLDSNWYDQCSRNIKERVRRFFLNFRHRPPIVDEWVRHGYRFTEEKRGFDVVIAGDTVRDARAYGETLLCFLNHGTGIKNILYRNLSHQLDTRYQIFVEGRYRVERIAASGFQGRSEVHLVGLPKLDWYFQGRYRDRAELLRRWGLDPNRPTVLFAPTYKPTCMYESSRRRRNPTI